MTTFMFILITTLSGFGALFLIESMTKFPGNRKFQKNVELTTLIKQFYGERWAILMQIFLFLSMQSVNVASIIISIQTFDNLLIQLFGGTCGFGIQPRSEWYCVSEVTSFNSPFKGNMMLITLGYLVLLLMVIPLAFMKLTDNILIQFISFCATLIISLQWVDVFASHGYSGSLMPAIGQDLSQVVGSVMFNYAFVMVIPSWINSRHPSVPVKKTVWYSLGIATFIYLIVGLTGGASFYIPPTSNVLATLSDSIYNKGSLMFSNSFIFPIFSLITSIPVYIIVLRINLIQSKLCSKSTATFLSSVLPFFVVVPFQTGGYVNLFMNWTSLIFTSITNFIVPFLVYIFLDKRNVRKEDDEDDEDMEFLDYDLAINQLQVTVPATPALLIEADYHLGGSKVVVEGSLSPSKMNVGRSGSKQARLSHAGLAMAGNKSMRNIATMIQAKQSMASMDILGQTITKRSVSSLVKQGQMLTKSKMLLNQKAEDDIQEEDEEPLNPKKTDIESPDIPVIIGTSVTTDRLAVTSSSLMPGITITSDETGGLKPSNTVIPSIIVSDEHIAPVKQQPLPPTKEPPKIQFDKELPKQKQLNDKKSQAVVSDDITSLRSMMSGYTIGEDGIPRVLSPNSRLDRKARYSPVPEWLRNRVNPVKVAVVGVIIMSCAVFGTIIYDFAMLGLGVNVFEV